ncbi:hypothetical protein [Deinococcus xianganensis]|uniref:Uncharacterized protein n=1 Tax=Deinococcus xianganensis TaxID=1507289 RepID=A0A6I4YGX3_9DEIO|nr:hypothetical protein [Deinococcus xianganensis]MXV19226.1 hypothetical protein [Deinococcus xianganensis]
MSPREHEQLARSLLQAALEHQRTALAYPDDYRAGLAARTLAQDALHHAQLAEPRVTPVGVIIRT